ncbi:peptidase m61 domain-containing protein [Colletotrichum asianum]|uniref:Peptidase m61 domain-containing protein n=1 Tax=Colletotrichum asianum TaxID=702518 RepID=A0A8H3VTP0_9PEZI|nr:peptidase m61 domain-containing protein [Colletotrichum asianum]
MGPLFDIRENAGGILGSIWVLVPVPDDTSTKFQIALSWDLSASPSGTRGVWTWGEGPQPVTINGTADDILSMVFAVGPILSSSSASEDSQFNMYWLEQPPFNVTYLASFIKEFYDYSATFWQDDGTKPYKVFIRYNENVGTGGTALYNSFTFGWHDRNKTTTNDTELLLAHETTHNWPYIYNGNLSDQTRYAEGTAEFYSLRNLWRAGLLSTLEYVTAMNTKAVAYYQNPSINLTDQEAVDQSWTIPTAQTIPYGRGLIYLANVDAEVRARWSNTRSLDDVVVELMNLCRVDDSSCTTDAYFDLLTKYAGSSAVDEYKIVASGDPVIRPIEGSLGPCFEVVQSYTNATVWTWQLRDGFDIDDDKCHL